jgi:hypothetical protein
MRIAVKADNGDEAAIGANVVTGELALVTLESGTARYSSKAEPESVTLTADKARELAKALMSVADAVEFVRAHDFALP